MKEQIVYKAISSAGEVCHFGVMSLAKIWAGQNGSVQEIKVKLDPPKKRMVSYVCPCCNFSMIRQEND